MTMWKPVALIVVFTGDGGTGASGGAAPPDLP